VTEIVPHERLLPHVMDCALAMAEVPPPTAAGLKQAYDRGASTTLAHEREIAARHSPDFAGIEQRRIEVMARNRGQMNDGNHA
jgi:enoyl-CoA hydratase